MLNFPSSPTNGQTYSDPNSVSWEFDGVKWNVVNGTAYKMYSGVKLGLTSAYALTSTSLPITFDSEVIDTDSYFASSTPSRVNINRSAYYRINFSVYSGTDGSSFTFTLKRNGSVTLSTVTIAPNQFANYDEVIELDGGDFLEVYGSESSSVGTILTTTFLELTRLGLLIGTTISSAEAFSGVRGVLTNSFNTTTTPTPITWNSTEFNMNADPTGNTYWTITDSSKFTISTQAYYRVKGVIDVGTSDDYTVTLKKNGMTDLTSATIEPNGYAQVDEIYNFNQGDYLQLFVNDSNSTGSLTTDTYLEIIRVGV